MTSRRTIRACVAAAAVIAVISIGDAAAPASAHGTGRCAVRNESSVAAARDCIIRGTISGRFGDMVGGELTWTGTLVLRQRIIDPVTRVGDRKPFYILAAGSRVQWTASGTTNGCTRSGGGTLDSNRLSGSLGISGLLRPGVWRWGIGVGPRQSRNATRVMPVTLTCPDGRSTVGDAAGLQGMVFAYNGYALGQPARNVETDGDTFAGRIRTQPGNQEWSWDLEGEAFASEAGQHGVDFIEVWEGLAERCDGSGRKTRTGRYVCAYEDSVGYCTIGYGHLIHGKQPCNAADRALRWTPAQAERELRKLLAEADFGGKVRVFSKKYGLNQCQFDALLAFVYNVSPKSWASLTTGLGPTTTTGSRRSCGACRRTARRRTARRRSTSCWTISVGAVPPRPSCSPRSHARATEPVLRRRDRSRE